MELDLSNDAIAASVHRITQRAYRVEAELIGFDGIPPLHESLDEMRSLPLRWLGIIEDGVPVAFLGWQRDGAGTIDIDRLCVDPDHFRRGLARRLLQQLPPDGDVIVWTGADNVPATSLYRSMGFRQTCSLEPEPGLLLVSFRLIR